MDQLQPSSDSSWVGLADSALIEKPSPRPIVIDTGADLDYAALLRAIPGFQGYKSPHSTSSTIDHTLQAPKAHDGLILQEDPVDYLAANFGSSDDGIRSVGANSLVNALPELNKISRQRRNLLGLELRIERVQKKLKILRQELSETVGKSAGHIDLVEVQGLIPTFHIRQSLRHIRELLSEVAREEDELEPLQQELTIAQYTVKEAEDQLYAMLSGGAKPGDSDASIEDRMFTEAVQQVADGSIYADSHNDAYNSSSPSKSYEQTAGQPPLPVRVLVSGALGSMQAIVDMDQEHTSAQNLTTAQGYSMEFPQKESGARLLVSPAKQKVSIATDIVFLGSHFHSSYDKLAEVMKRASKDEQLTVSPLLAELRKKDLRVALGFDLMSINRTLVLTEQQEKDVRAGVVQKLTNINRQITLHRKQHVTFWLRDMSQNSASESIRTILYGYKFLERLVSSGRLGPLDHIIHDIRRLEVPFDAEHEDDHRPLVVGHRRGPSSSIIAQPSSKDMHAYQHYKNLFHKPL